MSGLRPCHNSKDPVGLSGTIVTSKSRLSLTIAESKERVDGTIAARKSRLNWYFHNQAIVGDTYSNSSSGRFKRLQL